MTRLATFPDVLLKPVRLMAGLLALAACAPTVRPEPPQAQAPAPAPIISEQLEPLAPVDRTVKVALLVPLTGNAAELGQARRTPPSSPCSISPMTISSSSRAIPRGRPAPSPRRCARGHRGGRPDYSRAAVLVVGRSGSAGGAGRPAQHDLVLQRPESRVGSGVWTIGFAPDDQVRRVVSYGKSQGINRIGAMVPRNAYGEVVSNALNDTARKVGARVVRTERYDAGKHRLLTRGAGAGIRRAGQPGRRDDHRGRPEAAQRRLTAAGLPDRPGAGPAARHGQAWTIPRWGPPRPWSAAGTPPPIPQPVVS